MQMVSWPVLSLKNCATLQHLEIDPTNLDSNFYPFSNSLEAEWGKAVPTYVYPDCFKAAIRKRLGGHIAVSYTHLTLPTKLEV